VVQLIVTDVAADIVRLAGYTVRPWVVGTGMLRERPVFGR